MTRKILLIDDDMVLSKTTAKRLEKRGFEVEVCHSGVQGKALAEDPENDIGLILLDVKIPDLDGLEILRSLRQNFEKNLLPIIMVSSMEEQNDIVTALSCGANDYVTKPINIDILEARIDTQFDTKRIALEFTAAKELGVVAAMIATYNHEINNPLAIAFGTLDSLNMENEINEIAYKRMENSLDRIKDIVKKIGKLSDNSKVNFENYTEKSKMIKVD